MKQRFAIVVLLILVGAMLPAAAQERVALVIGNGKYAHAGPLPNPASDARVVATALREVGFDVLQGSDLDRNGMERLGGAVAAGPMVPAIGFTRVRPSRSLIGR